MAASAVDEPRINDRIRAREVRVIGPEGDQLGIRALPEALNLARGYDLDLVEVAAGANPPVVRIMDYRKYRYEAQQRAKESRRKSTNIVVKEMKYRPKIGDGDFWTKTRKVMGFLDEGHKVKITIMFRGREVQHPELGRRILDRIAEECRYLAKVEAHPRQDGRNMTMVLGPDKKVQAAHAAELKRLQEQEDKDRHDEEQARAEAAATESTEPGIPTEAEVSEAGVSEAEVSEAGVSEAGVVPVPEA